MRKFLSHYLLVFIFTAAQLLPVVFCHAQSTDTAYNPVDTVSEYNNENDISVKEDKDEESDTEIEPVLRTIPADTITAIKANPDFIYITYLDSLLRAVQKAKDNKPVEKEPESSFSFWDLGIVKFICWAVAIGLVGFVLYKLFLSQGVFYTNKKQALPAVELEDTPDENNLERALQQAIKKGDYRMATRYLFLVTLSRLGEKGILQLSTEKTNYQYATELSNKPYANRFAQLSLQYEYVWFGGFTINENQFTTLQQQHQQFLKEI